MQGGNSGGADGFYLSCTREKVKMGLVRSRLREESKSLSVND